MSTHATDFDEGITGGVILELTLSLVGGLVRADPLSDMKAPWRRPRSGSGRRSLHDDLHMRQTVGDL